MNNKIKKALGLGALVLALNGCSAINKSMNLQQRLYVNQTKDHYTMPKSRTEGEQDLYKLTQESDVEEAWQFVKYSNNEQFWHEIGENETNGTTQFNIKNILELLEDNHIEEISLYHFHPKDTGKNALLSETLSQIDLLGDIEIINIIKKYNPSLADKVDFKVVVPKGIYTLKFDKKIYGLYNNENLISAIADSLYKLEMERASSLIENRPLDPSKFAEKFSTDLYKITFEPKK